MQRMRPYKMQLTRRVPLAPNKGNRFYKEHTQDCDNDSSDSSDIDEHGKILIGIFDLSFTKRLCNNGTTTGSDHETESADAHQKRHDQINRCKSAFSNKVGDKKSVNHTVNGCEDHHYNRRKHKLQKFFISKVFG